jgi:PKD repeat protein
MKKQYTFLILLCVAILFSNNNISAQQFTEEASLEGMGQGSVAWGDYNNDGNIDIVVSGLTIAGQATILYRNNGDNTFSDSGIPFTGLYNGSAAWGDCDNDGDLDLLITGTTAFTTEALTKIYRNNNGVFDEISTGLPGIYRSCVSWGDVDRDGDLDILMTGMATTAERISRIYLNNGTGVFSLMQGTSFVPVYKGWSSFGDIDNDGYPDVVVTGETATLSRIAKVYRNNQDGSFSELANTFLTGLAFGSGAWGDFNGDGYLDLITTGEDANFTEFTKVYINNKEGNLIEITGHNLGGVKNSTLSAGDYDNDGDLDLFLSGDRNSIATSELFTNNGNAVFSKNQSVDITGTNESSSGFCDIDNDRDLDLIVTGINNSDFLISKIYLNNNVTPNDLPGKPLNLDFTVDKTTATFTWDRVTGDKTPSGSLSYNIRIGQSPTGTQMVSPQSDNSSGKRKIVSIGNTELSNTLELKNLRWNTDYYASVQAIDNSFEAGIFSDPVNFSITPKQPNKLVGFNFNTSSILLRWERGNGDRCILFAKEGTSGPSSPVNNTTYFANSFFGDGSSLGATGWYCIYKGTADSVILTGLDPAKDYTVHAIEFQGLNGTELYATETNPDNDNIGVFSSGIFTVLSGISMTGLGAGSVNWGDYNNDGYLDILTTGRQVDGTRVSKIYKNNGDNTFTDQTSISIPGVDEGSSAWGDYNNDDLLDFILTGYNQSLGPISRVYKNNGNNTFTWMESISLTGVFYSSASWADYDNDGDLDLLIAGQNLNIGLKTGIYRNDGNNTFTEQTGLNLKPVYKGSVAWGDYNNDGLLDILLTGLDGVSPSARNISVLYKNNGNGTFTEQTAIEITDVSLSSVAWGDYDNDGNLDILLTGSTGYQPDYKPVTKVYHNNGDNSFTELTGSSITGISMSSAEWGDYNNDGHLDILLTGFSESNLEFSIYLNDGNNGFHDLTALNIPGAYYCKTSSADYDSDGDLDILFTGNTGTFTSQIYRNNLYMMAGEIKPNTRPEAPTDLDSEVSPGSMKLQWNGVNTDETWFINMSYNIRAKRVNEERWKVAPHSTGGGFRSLNALGNSQLNRTFTINNPESGTYLWQVQAVDQSYSGSEWSQVDTVIIKKTQSFFKTDTVCLGSVTHFTDQSVVTEGIASWKWDFTDGTTSAIQNPEHTFSTPGSFNVKLVVTSSAGDKDSLIQKVIVKGRPSAAFTAPNVCIGSPTIITNNTNLNGLTIAGWNWTFGNGQASAAEQPGTHTYAVKGTYKATLKAIATNGCSDSITKDVIIASYPEKAISTDKPLIFCEGDSVTLTAEYDSLYTYQWVMDDNNITNATAGNFTVKAYSAKYSAKITNTLAACVTISDQKSITIKEAPATPAIVSDNYKTGECLIKDAPIKLRVDQVDERESYTWLRNGVQYKTATYIEGFPEQGNYVVAAELNGCKTQSGTFVVNYVGAPEKPVIYARGPTVWYLTSSINNAVSYNWYYNGNRLIEATKDHVVANQNYGVYQLSISNSNGCFTRSDTIVIPLKPTGITGIEDADPFTGLSIYPNPTTGMFSIEMNNNVFGTLIIDILNQNGSKALNIKFEKTTEHFMSQIDLSGQSKGLYLINLSLDKFRAVRKVVVE